VGEDAAMTDRTHALAQAVGEAITNAAKHSGSEKVSVFLEGDGDHIEVFVADQGVGFDPERVPEDRQGIASSMIGRMKRSGGGAEIASTEGEGTEVRIWVKP